MNDLVDFLRVDANETSKRVALDYALGLTASRDGRRIFVVRPTLIDALLELTRDRALATDAFAALINLAAEDETRAIMSTCDSAERLVDSLTTSNDSAFDACRCLSNFTRSEDGAREFVRLFGESRKFHDVVDDFCDDRRSSRETSTTDYFVWILANVTQIDEGRRLVLDKTRKILQRLLPFTDFSRSSDSRRRGVVSMIRNCCFETEYHDWLLGYHVDLLPHLLLPLAGPEEFDEEDMKALPDDLQYLGEDKTREPEADIRKMLLESIMQLCSTKKGRLFVKEKNTYVIIRELHRQEDDANVSRTCESLINLLISDEPEKGMDDLRKVTIPKDVEETFAQEQSISINT